MVREMGGKAAAAIASLTIAAVMFGCGKSLPPKADIKQSREALEAALTAWKEGSPPERLKERSPPVDFRDPAWESGKKLVRFEIQKEETAGVSARFTVALTLLDNKTERKRSAAYNADIGSAIVMRFRFGAAVLAAWCAAVPAWPQEPVVPKGVLLRPSRETQAQLWKEAMKAAENKNEPPRTEAARMLAAMMSGGKMDGSTGWWGPSERRYGWDWLARRYDRDGDGRITMEELGKHAELLARLDRDRDGAVTAEDLDWSEKSTFVRQQTQAMQIFRLLDKDGNGQLTREEWNQAFDRLAKQNDVLTPTDLQAFLFPSASGKGKAGKGPSKEVLMKAFLEGDAGSPFEGPKVGEQAPDFNLPTYDGKGKIALSDYRGKKPVVLVFGSFT